ncbi:MAG: AI-2E family transporter [Thermoplasmatota archaeon]
MVESESERALLIRERRFLLGLTFISGVIAIYIVRDYVAWAILGLILGYVLIPAHERLTKALGTSGRAAGVLVVGVAVGLIAIFAILIYSVAKDISRLVDTVSTQGLGPFIDGALAKVLPPAQAASVSATLADKIQTGLADAAPGIAVSILDATVGIFILSSALFAVLLKRDEIAKWFRRVVPLRPDREQAFFKGIFRALDGVLYGVIVVAALQAATGGIIWYFSGLPNALFFTAVMFIFSMVPALGPSMVLLPGAVYAYISGNHVGAYVLIGGTVVAIGIIDYVIRPKIIRAKGGLDETLALLSIIGGITTMGAIGVLAGPIIVAVFLAVVDLTMQTHFQFGGDYDSELFEPSDPIVGEKPAKGKA